MPSLDLALQGGLAEAVPAVVEHTLVQVLGQPVGGRRVRRVTGALRVVHQERAIRRQRTRGLHPGDRLVRHVGVEVVALLTRRAQPGHPVDHAREQVRLLTGDVAVELVEPAADRPTIERAADVDLGVRNLVVLAEVAGAVAPRRQHRADRRHAQRTEPGVTRKRRARPRHGRHAVLVAVATGQQRRPRRRARRVDLEVRVRHPVRRQPVQRRRADPPAEHLRVGVARLIHQHDHHVRRTLRRSHPEQRRRIDLAVVHLRDRRLPRRHHRYRLAVQVRILTRIDDRSVSHELPLFVTRPGECRMWLGTSRTRKGCGSVPPDGVLAGQLTDLPSQTLAGLPVGQRIWCGKLLICPNEMVPLQIDRAIRGSTCWRPSWARTTHRS